MKSGCERIRNVADEKKSWKQKLAAFIVTYGPTIAEEVFKLVAEYKAIK